MSSKILFAGTPANAARTLEALVGGGFDIALVITKPDAPVGRNKIVTQSPVALAATKLGLQCIKSEEISEEVMNSIRATGSTIGLVVAYGSILKSDALQVCEDGWFNLHYSLLPAFRGAAPVQRALIAGELETGVTLFKLDSGVDTGHLVSAVPTQIQPNENSTELLGRLTELGITLLRQELPALLTGLVKTHPQSGQASKAPKLTKDECLIVWNEPALQIHNLIRGANPEPGAWTYVDGQVFKIHESRILEGSTSETGVITFQEGRVSVGCGQGSSLELLVVQPSGKPVMNAADWARGSRVLRFEL